MPKVVRFADYDRKSSEPDAEGPRDPAEPCIIIILPIIRVEQQTKTGRKQ
jgi:hypothetical protein